jgi:hypothetical protein
MNLSKSYQIFHDTDDAVQQCKYLSGDRGFYVTYWTGKFRLLFHFFPQQSCIWLLAYCMARSLEFYDAGREFSRFDTMH